MLISAVVFGIAHIINPNATVVSILNSVTSGPELLTGGSFGPEASIILMILGLVLCIWVGAKLIVRK